MEKSKRARKRKPETSQGGPGAADRQFSGGQGVHCEVESEGHEEKCRAVINGGYLKMNRSAKGGTRSNLHYGGEGGPTRIRWPGAATTTVDADGRKLRAGASVSHREIGRAHV